MNLAFTSKIFVVDDDLFCQAIYQQHLQNLGFNDISVFSSGTDLLSCLDQKPDLVFLDYNLDDYTGDELLTLIKEKNTETFVVIISGQADMEITVTLMKKGAFDYIVKDDSETNKISLVIDKWLSARDVKRQLQLTGNINPTEKYLHVIVEAQEKIRKEISCELHDNVSQLLGASKLYIETAGTNAEIRHELLNDSKRFIENAITEIRKISHRLVNSVAYAETFSDSLTNLFSFLEKQKRFKVDNSISARCIEPYLNKDQQHHVVRILQELVNNTIKYAEASVFTLNSSIRGEQLEMTISDNGRGFDSSANRAGIGLNNIRDRVTSMTGNYSLTTAPGQGCTWKISIPIKNKIENSRSFSAA